MQRTAGKSREAAALSERDEGLEDIRLTIGMIGAAQPSEESFAQQAAIHPDVLNDILRIYFPQTCHSNQGFLHAMAFKAQPIKA